MVLCVHDMDHMSNPMRQKILPILLIFLSASVFAQNPPNPGNFWQGRVDVSGLDLFDGSGGASRQPGTQFQFLKESLSGTSPKFEVEDENGVKWKVKLGEEVKAETAATRLVWAAGYYVDEDYYRPEIRVEGMKKLSRGQQYVHNGTVVNVRLERHRSGPDPMTWNWYEDSYSNTREFNGLRVVMALINNWDLKEVNNAVYERSDGKNFAVADLDRELFPQEQGETTGLRQRSVHSESPGQRGGFRHAQPAVYPDDCEISKLSHADKNGNRGKAHSH